MALKTVSLSLMAMIVLGSPIQAADTSWISSSELTTNVSGTLVRIRVLPVVNGYSIIIEEAMQPGLGSRTPLPAPSMICRCFNRSVDTKTCPGDRNGLDPSGICDCSSAAKIWCGRPPESDSVERRHAGARRSSEWIVRTFMKSPLETHSRFLPIKRSRTREFRVVQKSSISHRDSASIKSTSYAMQKSGAQRTRSPPDCDIAYRAASV